MTVQESLTAQNTLFSLTGTIIYDSPSSAGFYAYARNRQNKVKTCLNISIVLLVVVNMSFIKFFGTNFWLC